MGSWDETCAISHLAVGYQDPMRVLVLAENPWPTKRGGAGRFWAPVCLPVRSTYDDYGLGGSTCEVEADFALKTLVGLCPALSGCETFDDAYAVLRDSRLGIGLKDPVLAAVQGNGEMLHCVVTTVMVKEPVWQSLMQISTVDEGYRRWEHFDDPMMQHLLEKRPGLEKFNYSSQDGSFSHGPFRNPINLTVPDPVLKKALYDLDSVDAAMHQLRLHYGPSSFSGCQHDTYDDWQKVWKVWEQDCKPSWDDEEDAEADNGLA